MFLSDSLFSNSANIRNDYPISFCRFSFIFIDGFSIQFPFKEECLEMFNLDAKVFKEKQENFLNLIHPDFLSSFIFTLNKSKALQTTWEWAGKFKIEDKNRILSFKASPNLADERALWDGVIVDITKLKPNAEDQPKLSEVYQGELGRLAHIGTWSIKVEPFLLTWDEESQKLHNLDSSSFSSIKQVVDLYPKEYRSTIQKSIKSAIISKTSFDLEIPYTSINSHWKWLRISGEPIQKLGMVTKIIGIVQDVTKEKEMEEKIRQNDRFLMDNHFINNGSWLSDLRNGVNIWSTEALKLFGFDPEIQGPSLEEFEKRIHPNDFQKYKEALVQGIKSKKTIGHNFKIVLPSGEIKQISTIAKSVYGIDGRAIKICGYFKNGEYDPTEVQASTTPEDFNSFVKSCPVALAILDSNLNFIRVSDRFIEAFELQSTKVLGKNLYQISSSINERLGPLLKNSLENGSSIQKSDEEFMLINERWEWVRWEVQSWYKRKDVKGGYTLMTEFITERKQAEADLIRAKEKAEKATLAKSEFLSSISHEIRTPLNAVIGFTNLLLQENLLPNQQEYLNIIKFSSENLSTLLADILDFGKIEADKVILEKVEFNPRELLSKIRLNFLDKAKAKNLAFRIMMDEDIPKTLLGDPERLKQILSNLIGNAIKFTFEGKVVINLSLTNKDMDYSTLLFEILDTGIGIEKNLQNEIFDGFTQRISDNSREYGGTGLGLSITQKLTKLFDGKVWVESEIGKGSTFFLKLRFKNIAQELSPDHGTGRIESSELVGLKVLVVEDNPINSLLTKVILRQWQIDCDFAENGKIGYEMVQETDYDLVFMDLQMPVLDGYEATKKIRRLPEEKYKLLPVVALTASVLEDSKERALMAGLDDFLMKPVSHSDMFNTLKKFMDKKQSWKQTSLIRNISGKQTSPKISNA